MNYGNIEAYNFEEIKSEYLKRWLNILCNNEVRYNEFVSKFLNKNNVFLSVSEYQRYLKASRDSKAFNLEGMQEALDNGDEKTLNYLLEELFMEPIDCEAVNRFMKLAKDERIRLNDLISYHQKDQSRSFWLTMKKVM